MRSLRILAVAAAALAATAASANVTVVRAIGASARAYPPGTSLPDTATLRLAAGDSVMVLGARGTRTFRGPGTFRLDAPTRPQSIAQAIGRPRATPRIGAVRGNPPGGSDIWNIDISRGGNACYVGTAPVLWRSEGREASRLTVRAADGPAADVTFDVGSRIGDWPSNVPLRNDTEYWLGSGGGGGVSIRLIQIQPVPSNDQEAAALLIRNGCEVQLDRLLASTPEG
ncbi:MAG TPA: hypothetical protein VF704_07615 [Allosphingosinicella sp.]|jgi:hypothetical protein